MTDQITKADIDAAVEAALAPVLAKNSELLGEVKDLKGKLRATAEIKPEDFSALEAENDRLKADLAKSQKEAKEAVKAADAATKALETEQGAARRYALDAELATAISEGNVVPALVPAFKAMIAQQAKADLVDGAYAVTIGDKSARDHIKGFLDSDEGKAFRAAPINGGGGANGGKNGGAAKVAQSIESIPLKERQAFFEGGGVLAPSQAA